MANRYWVGGSGTWGSTASWSASSGGASGASVPTNADDVFFDASSDGAGNAAFTVTLGANATCLSLNFSAVDQNVTFTGAFTLSVVGNLVLSPTKTISVTGITALSMTATTSRTITSGGGTLTGGISFAGSAGTWTLQDAFTITGTVTHTLGTIAFNGFTFTAARYTNTGTSTRALNFTTAGSKFAINATTTSTVWSIASTTGLTITSPTTGSVDIVGSANITRTISTLALTEANSLNFNILATAGTITATASNTFRNLTVNCPGATFSNIAITVYGNLSYLGGTWAAGTNLLTLAPSSGSFTITGTGGAFDFPITYNSQPSGAGAYTLASNVTVGATAARTFTHQQGTLNLSSYTLTVYGTFNTSGIATRTLNFGTGFIDLTLDGSTTTTIWDSTTVNTLTVLNAATGAIRVKGSGTLVRNINTGGLSETNSLSFEFLSTAGTITLTNATSRIKNLIINCPGTTISNVVIVCYGNFTHTAGTLNAGTNILTFGATSGTQTISSVATLDFPITFNGAGGTFELGSNLTIGTSTSRAVVHTNGIVDFKGYNITLYGTWALSQGTFAVTRQLKNTGGGSNKLILTIPATVSTQVFNANDYTSFTTDGNVNIQITGTGLYFMGRTSQGTVTNNFNVQVSSTSGTVVFGDATWGGSFKNLTIDNNSVTVQIFAAVFLGNYTVAGTSPTITYSGATWTWAATSGTQTINLNGHASNTINTAITVNGAGGTLQLQHSLNVGTSTSRTVTLTAGTLDLNGYTLTIFGVFSNSTTSVRTLAFGSTGKIVLTTTSGSSLTICNTSTETNLTVTGTNPLIQVTGSGVGPLTIAGTSSLISLQLSPSSATTINVTNNVKDFIIDNSSNITLSNSTRSVYGSLTIGGTNPTLVAGALVTTFAATSGTKTITTAGKNLDFPITFNGVGGTWQLQDALSVGTATSRVVTLTNGTLDLNGYTLTHFGEFLSTSSNVRTIAFGSTGNIVLTLNVGDGTNAINTSGTNLTVTGTNPLVQVTGWQSAAFLGCNFSNHTESNSFNVQLSSTSTASLSVAGAVKNLTIDNNTAITCSFSGLTIYGNLLISGTNPTVQGGTSAVTFAATSGTQTITTNGETLDFPITVNNPGAILQLQDALTIGSTRNTTLTAGTLDLNEYTLSTGTFLSNNSNVREIDFGSAGKIVTTYTVTNTATVVNCATVTNLTITGTSLIEMSGSNSSSRIFNFGGTAGLTESNAPNLSILVLGTGQVDLANNSGVKNLTVNTTTAYVGTSSVFNCYGNLNCVAGSISGGTIYFKATSGTQTITLTATPISAFTFSIVIDGVGGTVQAASNLSTLGTFTLTNGTFNASSYNMTFSTASSNNSNVRTLTMGSGTWTFSGTGAIWNTTTTTNFTFNKGTANISSTHNSITLVEFRGGGLTYNNFTTTSTTNRVDIYGNNTFNTFTIASGGALRFEAGSTNTFSTFSFGNNSGDNAALDTTTAGTAATLVYAGSSKIRTNYVTVRDITGSPVNTWYMGPNSTNTSNNTNLYFYNPPLYWIGGSGTWNNTNTTNWSFFSGGSSAGYYPDQYTDVTFDSNSDSGSSFDIVSGSNIAIACRDFTVSTLDNAMTFRVVGNSNTLSIYGNYSTPASNFSYTGSSSVSGSIVFASTSTGKTITTNGTSFLEVEFNGVGGGWTLQDNMTVSGDSSFLYLTAGTITLNDKILTAGQFWITGTTTRSIAFGTSGKLVHTSSQIWRGTTLTNFTATGNKRVEFTSSSFSRLEHGDTAGITELNALDVYITNLAGNVNVLLLGGVRNLDFTGSTGGWTEPSSAATLRIYGNLTVASGMSFDGSGRSGVLSFLGTVANGQTYQYITTNGLNIDFATITFNGTSQYVLLDQFSCGTSSTNATDMTLTAGTIVMGNYNIVHYGTFSGTGSGVRGITSTGGVWKLTNNLSAPATVWTTSGMTNMTNTDVTVEIYGTNDSVGRTVIPGSTGATESNAISFVIAATGSDTTTLSAGVVKNLTLNDTAYTLSSSTLTIYGNLTIVGSTPTLSSSTSAWTFAATSGTKTITTNGVTIDRPLIFSGVGGTWALQDALTIGATRITTLTAGTFSLNGYTCTAAGGFTATGTGSKVLAHGSGDLVISLAGATAFNATGSNLTSTGTGKISMTAATAKTFVGNGNSYATLNQGGVGALTITGSNTFQNITNSTQPASVLFTDGTTNTFTNDFDLNGTSGNLITIGSVTPASTFTLSKSSGTVDVSFCSISDSIATGGAAWYAGTTSTNGGNNTGWLFTNFVVAATSAAFLAFFFP